MATQVPVKRLRETPAGTLMRPFDVFQEMEELAQSMLPFGWMRPLPLERRLWEAATPEVDIIDRETELVVRAAVPGFAKDDIEVTTTKDAVTLRGQMRKEEEEGERGGEYYRREIRRAGFLRTIHLPCLVDDTQAKAAYRDGVLELTLPKAEPEKRHTVKIEEV